MMASGCEAEGTDVSLTEEPGMSRTRLALEGKLLESNELYRLLAEHSTDMISKHTPEGVYTYASPACRSLLGYDPGDLVGRDAYEFFHPDDFEEIRKTHSAILERPDTYTVAYRIRCKDGSYTWFETTSRTVREPENGEVLEIIAVSRDITERKRAEEELRESKRRTESILESFTDAFVAVDREWRFTYVNERSLLILQRTRGELLGKNMWEEFPEAVELPAYREYHRAMTSGIPIHFEEFNPWQEMWVEIHAYPSEHGLSIYFRDITKRKRAEKEIETRTHQQATVAELGLWALANDGLKPLMDHTVALVARTLGVEYSKIMELLPGGEELLLRAGVGWREGVVGSAREEAGPDSQAGYTLSESEPVIVEDLSAETRFSPSRLMREHGAVSGMTVVIPGREGPFGVLGTHTTSRRAFSEDDANFLQAVANVLAAAIERTEAEEQILFQAHLLEQVQTAVIATDMRGRVTQWNEHAEKLYGWTREEVLGQHITELTVGAEEVEAAEEVMDALRAGDVWEGEFEVRRKDGSQFWAHVTDSLIYDAEGRAVGIVGISTDITERKRTEEELRESEERFRAFFETAAVGAAHADPATGRFLQANEKLCDFLGYEREELLRMTFQDVTHPDDRERDTEGLSRLLRGEVREYSAEKRYVRKDGQMVWGQLAVSLVRDANGRALHTVAITQDITERRRLEESLREIREAERRRIARDLHDVVLQDLAGALQGMQAAQVESGNLVSELEQEMAALRRAVGSLRNVIYDLRVESDQPFARAVESLIELNRQLTPEREIWLTASDDFPPELPGHTDVELLRLLQEALVNARRHSDARHVEVILSVDQDVAQAEVADDGLGFDPASVRKGIGISGMRERASALGARLEVESAPGKGTSVRVEIPLSDPR